MNIERWTAFTLWTVANIGSGIFIGYCVGTIRRHRSTR